MKRVCTSVLVTLLVLSEARATFVGGDDLHEHCKKVDSSPYPRVYAMVILLLLQTLYR